MRGRALGLTGAIALALAAASDPVPAADPVAEFYAGRTINILVGFTTGGGYDLYARTLARYMGAYIPGHPAFVVQNMPGAGSLKVVNYLYALAARDGTTMATFARGMVVDPLLDHNDADKFDAPKFGWIGSISNEVSVCAFLATSGIRTWHDMLTKPSVIGSTGPGADSDIYPAMLRNLFHIPFKIIAGYPGASEVNLALERHEVDGRCGWSWVSLIGRTKALYDSGQLAITLQIGLRRLDELPDVPLVTEIADDPDTKAAIRLLVARQSMARPYAAPPQVPAERLAALRRAFDATMRDPGFLADTKRLELEVSPVSGAAVETLINEIYASPPAVVKRAAEAVKEP
jgi:tripartite-type tricarboxylate transporter receptor subunit TctC